MTLATPKTKTDPIVAYLEQHPGALLIDLRTAGLLRGDSHNIQRRIQTLISEAQIIGKEGRYYPYKPEYIPASNRQQPELKIWTDPSVKTESEAHEDLSIKERVERLTATVVNKTAALQIQPTAKRVKAKPQPVAESEQKQPKVSTIFLVKALEQRKERALADIVRHDQTISELRSTVEHIDKAITDLKQIQELLED